MHNSNECGLVHMGCGTDVSIKELAELIVAEVGYEGQFAFDSTKPDGSPRKLLGISKINKLGWNTKISPKTGLKQTKEEFKK